MSNWSKVDEILDEWKKIKGTKEVVDDTRVKENKVGGTSADDIKKRQQFLPSKEDHYRLQDKLSRMFDTTSRAGARSTLHNLILPGGRKQFSDFHDNYTGTGRLQKKKEPEKFVQKPNQPKIDARTPSVVFYKRCMDCMALVDKDNCVPNMIFIPSFEKLAPQEAAKWQAVDLKPGDIICYLFCVDCPAQAKKKVAEIRNDRIKNSIMVMGADGIPISLADKLAQEYMHKRSYRISDQVIAAIKQERDNPYSDVFYGNARK